MNLKGEYFTIHAADGQDVKKGDLLMEADIEKIKEAGYDVITPVIVCNPDDFSEIQMAESGDVAQGDAISDLKK